MKKTVKAVQPYIYKDYINFKFYAYQAWVSSGGKVESPHYLPDCIKGWSYQYELPLLKKSKKEARLRFVEAVSIKHDTFPDYSFYEIIPFIWDCWPRNYSKMERWFKRHNVKTAFFTSSIEMADMLKRVPSLNAMYCPEAVDTSLFPPGKELKDRSIDVLEFGRTFEDAISPKELKEMGIIHVATKVGNKYLYNDDELHNIMGDSKIVIALPRVITFPKAAEGIEKLTQRYWENMLSRNIMLGHAPKELVELIGYNPVIELEEFSKYYVSEKIKDILNNISSYQELVNKNRITALKLGDWSERISQIKTFLTDNNYSL